MPFDLLLINWFWRIYAEIHHIFRIFRLSPFFINSIENLIEAINSYLEWKIFILSNKNLLLYRAHRL